MNDFLRSLLGGRESPPPDARIVVAGPEIGAAVQALNESMAQEMRETTVEGISGGGMVRITMSLDGTPQSVKIDPELHPAEMNQALEDLVLAALQSAQRNMSEGVSRIQKRHGAEMDRIMRKAMS